MGFKVGDMLYRFARSILSFILNSHSEICEKKTQNGLQKTPSLAPKVSSPYFYCIRQLALYSTDDGSRQGFFFHVGGKKK